MQNSNKPKIIGIILAYRHASYLEGLYKKIPLDALDGVIITNDETGDGIERVAERLGIPCYSHPRLGYGGNMKYGMQKATELGADYVAEIHGDGQFDPQYIRSAIEKMKEGNCDLVLGSRFTNIHQPRHDGMPLVRYLANITLSFIDRIVLGVPLSEFHTGARLYSTAALKRVGLASTSDDHPFSFQIIAKFAYCRQKIGEVPVHCDYRAKHTSISIKRAAVYAHKDLRRAHAIYMCAPGLRKPIIPWKTCIKASSSLFPAALRLVRSSCCS